ncbi:hypothetical protein [Vibrio sp. D431a]|uniref:hypothetical protein n=1 Tax=Vibrio sp. D431a TaxID=2837388 RepID=UPI002554150E|nr:hypothetical protein [Vibrio sp. D431a]MDK9793237.1 hypothetical protein [Vibrio sp. D431a]
MIKFKKQVAIASTISLALLGCGTTAKPTFSEPVYTSYEINGKTSCHKNVIEFHNETDFTTHVTAIPCVDGEVYKDVEFGHVKDIIVLDGKIFVGLFEHDKNSEVLTHDDYDDADIPELEGKQPYFRVEGLFFHKKLKRCFELVVDGDKAFVKDADC